MVGPVTSDVVYPFLIAAGCGLVVAAVHLVTRRRPTRADIAVPESRPATTHGSKPDPGPAGEPADAAGLQAWHLSHEATLLAFMEEVGASARGNGPPRLDALGATLDKAAADHPAAEMRGELAGMHSAARAMFDAADRGDDDGMARHLNRYEQYRDVWLDRLAQFPIDPSRVADVRARARSDRR